MSGTPFTAYIPKFHCIVQIPICSVVCPQDLEYLSDGLEGRSKNPLSLLFDTLMQPNEDIGESHPPSLNWTQQQCKAISHVVLGSGKPGGSWHRMQSDVWSLSTGRWLQLPIYEYEDWERERRGWGGAEVQGSANRRVTLGNVAKYYERYIEKMGIAENFVNGVTVTQVQWLGPKERRSHSCESTFSTTSQCSSASEHAESIFSPEGFDTTQRNSSPESTVADAGNVRVASRKTQVPITSNVCEVEEEENVSDREEIAPCESLAMSDSDDTGISCCAKRICLSPCGSRWSVQGMMVGKDGHEQNISVCAKNVVLATGVGDAPKRLEVPGEDLDFVQHNFSSVTPNSEKKINRPILVVGAGLSAADAVIHALSSGLKVVHVFHQDPDDQKLTYHNMDPKIYSEYVRLFRLMRGKARNPNYTPLARHRVAQFSPGGVCTVCSHTDGSTEDIAVSLAVVLIGGRARLDFLPECISHRVGLKHNQPIEAKKNPMDLDAYTFESDRFPSLYAMGPLAGDNFVRFVLGGAIGITKNLRQKLGK